MKQITKENLAKLLKTEEYPYQNGLAPRFALALIGQNDELIEAYRSASGGQGANSRASFSEALITLQQKVPELLNEGIPFPFYQEKEIIIRVIPTKEAQGIISKMS